MKVFDVTAPTDKWDIAYAHLEYLRVGLSRPFSRKIEVIEWSPRYELARKTMRDLEQLAEKAGWA